MRKREETEVTDGKGRTHTGENLHDLLCLRENMLTLLQNAVLSKRKFSEQ